MHAKALGHLLSKPAIHAALIVAVTAGVYANTLDNAFHLDDHYRIANNPEIRRFWPPWRHFVDPATSSALPRIVQYRPLLPLSLSIDYALFGGGTRGFHLFAIFFHMLSALLVYAIASRLLRRAQAPPPGDQHLTSAPGSPRAPDPGRVALVVALMFAVHPISANPVNYLCARDLLLTVLGMLAGLWCFLRFAEGTTAANNEGGSEPTTTKARWAWLAAALVAHVLAMLAKTNAVALPLVIITVELTVLGSRWRSRGPWLRALPFFVLSVGFFILTERVLGFSDLDQVSPDKALGPFGYALSQAEFHLTFYLRSVVWPFAMHQDPTVVLPSSIADPGVLAGGVVIVASVGLALYNLRRRPLLAFAILAYWMLLAPTSSLVPMRRAVVDYRPYPGLAFLFLALVPVAAAWLTPRLRLLVALVPLAYFSASTIWFNTLWRTERTLWQHAVDSGGAALAHHNLAMTLRDPAQREKLLRRTLALSPGHVLAKINLGRALAAQGKLEAGLKLLHATTRQASSWAQPHYWYGMTLTEHGRHKEALPYLWQAAKIQPRSIRYQYQAGRGAQLAGRVDASLKPLAIVWRREPMFRDTGHLYGYALQMAGRLDQALAVYRAFLAKRPEHVAARFNLAHALLNKTGCATARPHLERVLARQPKHKAARFHHRRCEGSAGKAPKP